MGKTVVFLLTLPFLAACSGAGTNPPDEVPADVPPALFIAVHHEPGPDPASDGYASLHWPELVQLVAAADVSGHRLTLLMNPQWVRFILADAARTAQARSWEAGGHELGLHSHGPSMNAWNGYSDQVAARLRPEYLGPMDSLMALMNRLPASGAIRTAAVTDGDADTDYPAGILYDVDGGGAGLGDLVATPAPVGWSGHTMTGLRHARYCAQSGGVCLSTTEIGTALDGMTSTQVAGLVFHVFEFGDAPDPFRTLFEFLRGRGVLARSVGSIMAGR